MVTGRQLVRPSASRRPADQIRQESAAAAVAAFGMTLAALHWRWGLILTVLGYTTALVLHRRPRDT